MSVMQQAPTGYVSCVDQEANPGATRSQGQHPSGCESVTSKRVVDRLYTSQSPENMGAVLKCLLTLSNFDYIKHQQTSSNINHPTLFSNGSTSLGPVRWKHLKHDVQSRLEAWFFLHLWVLSFVSPLEWFTHANTHVMIHCQNGRDS